jgi:RNA polymerase sigma-70 factor (ECF subfamily)
MSPGSDNDSDTVLIERARVGDGDAFAALVDRHRLPIVRYLARLCRNAERADDLAHETFVRLFLALPAYRDEGHLLAWLYRTATNLVRSEERRATRWRWVAWALRRTGSGEAPSADTALDRTELRAQLEQALAALPLEFRSALVLYEVEDLPYEEIARVTGCKEGTVKSRISRGRALLRERLQAYKLGVEAPADPAVRRVGWNGGRS